MVLYIETCIAHMSPEFVLVSLCIEPAAVYFNKNMCFSIITHLCVGV